MTRNRQATVADGLQPGPLPAGRPPSLTVVVTGTSTEVGKTWVTVKLVLALRERGLRVSARKPTLSFNPGDRVTDAHLLADATGEKPEDVCPPHRCYEVAMAPPMAAAALERPPFTIDDLVGELRWPAGPTDVGLIESAGGVRSPIATPGTGRGAEQVAGPPRQATGPDLALPGDDTVALVGSIDPGAVVLVADASLGTINAVRLCTEALGRPSIDVVLNRFDPHDLVHRANADWLRDVDGLRVHAVPRGATLHDLADLADALTAGLA